jgi:hypothetical protein
MTILYHELQIKPTLVVGVFVAESIGVSTDVNSYPAFEVGEVHLVFVFGKESLEFFVSI